MPDIEDVTGEAYIIFLHEIYSLMRDILQVMGYPVPENADENEVNRLFDLALDESAKDMQLIEAQECSQEGIPAGGDCREAIQPEPLDAMTWTTLIRRGKRNLFPLAKRRVTKFREALRRALFKGH